MKFRIQLAALLVSFLVLGDTLAAEATFDDFNQATGALKGGA